MPILHWLTRETDLKTSLSVPYRLLEPVAELSAGEPSENMLIQGDNLEALKALLPFYAGKVKVSISTRPITPAVPSSITTTILNTPSGWH